MMGNEAAALVSAALAARKNAYVPYSGYPVGAAVLGEDGNIFIGCNVENVSYPAGMCAERNAIGSAVTAGCTSFQGIAVAGSDKGFTMPCGICRQVIAEFHIPVVIVAKDEDHYKIFDGSKLLPHAFEEGCLKTGERNG